MKIGCVIFFNDGELLKKCLQALKSKVDRIVAIDGAYKDFPHLVPYSTDGSIEVAEKFADEVIKVKYPWEDEIAKRNRYLECAKTGDFIIVVDADEELEGDLSGIKEDFYQLMLYRVDGVPPYPVFRVHKKIEDMFYSGTHHSLWCGDELINLRKDKIPVLEGAKLIHRCSERDKQRIENKGTYYRIIQEKEIDFRQEFGL